MVRDRVLPARERAQHVMCLQPHPQKVMLPVQTLVPLLRARMKPRSASGLDSWAGWEAGVSRSAPHADFCHRIGTASAELAAIEAQHLAKGITIPEHPRWQLCSTVSADESKHFLCKAGTLCDSKHHGCNGTSDAYMRKRYQNCLAALSRWHRQPCGYAGAPLAVANTEKPQAIGRGTRAKTRSPCGDVENGGSVGPSMSAVCGTEPGAQAARCVESAIHLSCMCSSTGTARSIPIPCDRKMSCKFRYW